LFINLVAALLAIVTAFQVLNLLGITLGILFALFFPGYSLLAALYVRKDDICSEQRVVLSFAYSIASGVLVALVLTYLPWGMGVDSILLTLLLATMAASALGTYRRRRLLVEETEVIPLSISLPRWEQSRVREIGIPVLYLLAITAAEMVTVFIRPGAGVITHIFLLVALIVHSSLVVGRPERRLLLPLTLAPLTRILSLSMPLGSFVQIYWYPIIYAPLLLGSLLVIRNLDFRASQIGIKMGRLPFQLSIGLTGVVFGIMEYVILSPPLLTPQFTLATVWLPALLFMASTGFVEELIFRGVLQRAYGDSWGWWGIVYVSGVFAVLHMGFLSFTDLVFVFAVALFFGWMVKRTGSILGVSLSHGITNGILYLVIPLFVS
jgi:hypothetical protein